MPATKRRSSSITLVLVGASTIGACGEQDAGTMRRDVYAARSDCVQDWGSDPAKCEPVTTSSGRSSYTHYYGPYYSHGGYGSTRSTHPSGTQSAARPGSRAISTAHVSRGGFGGSAASHGSSGRAGGS
jgi:uncharacterized protein YgiB involved in biofilm formation